MYFWEVISLAVSLWLTNQERNSTEVTLWGIQYVIYTSPHAVIWLREHQQNMQ